MTPEIAITTSSGTSAPQGSAESRLRAKAQELEASFLSQMLKYGGVAKPMETLGGGVGEEQFSSFLCDEYGKSMAARGGIGLAESIFHALQRLQREA